MSEHEDLKGRLGALAGDGAARFDAAAVGLARSLLERAAWLEAQAHPPAGDGGAALLRRRAARVLDRLEPRFSAARDRARRTLDELSARGLDPTGALAAAFAAGDLVTVARAARRHRLPSLRERAGLAGSDDATAVAPLATSELEGGPRYQVTAGEVSALCRVARAVAQVPDDAGAYNGQRVASRVLDAMAEISTAYLRTQVERLEELALLERLP
jgi:hypothetical protein